MLALRDSPIPTDIDRKNRALPTSETNLLDVDDLLSFLETRSSAPSVRSRLFTRTLADLPRGGTALVDAFPDIEGARCCFFRFPAGHARILRFTAAHTGALEICAAGGWLVESVAKGGSVYWIPAVPFVRSFDSHGRIVIEDRARIVEFQARGGVLSLSIQVPDGLELDWAFWRLDGNAHHLAEELRTTLNLERKPYYLWSSQSIYRSPADLYLYLVFGNVYQNARAWPRKWRFFSELDAYELYLTLCGLELATGKTLYRVLRRQILLSVVARQHQDGAWYHGEWTDQMEWHARFHVGALLLLEHALQETGDPVVREALEKGAAFAASMTDRTDVGSWFLHDSLEKSPEAMDQLVAQMRKHKGSGAWKPSRMLGKSPANKMVLNTHLDTTVALDRFCAITGDHRYTELVSSAVKATEALLDLRPAEALYRALYRAVGLTLLPARRAERLSLLPRIVKRLTWQYLIPQLYRMKRAFPRFVMPGGFTERHLSPLHFDPKYHAVNVLDLARLWRRFPSPAVGNALAEAVRFVTATSILDFWAEAKPRHFAIVVWADALYHLCMLEESPDYRQHLADAMIRIDDIGLGYPPSLLGGSAEAVEIDRMTACPSPADSRLAVANLSGSRGVEIIVVNPTTLELDLDWENLVATNLMWSMGMDRSTAVAVIPRHVPARGWLWGRAVRA